MGSCSDVYLIVMLIMSPLCINFPPIRILKARFCSGSAFYVAHVGFLLVLEDKPTELSCTTDNQSDIRDQPQ